MTAGLQFLQQFGHGLAAHAEHRGQVLLAGLVGFPERGQDAALATAWVESMFAARRFGAGGDEPSVYRAIRHDTANADETAENIVLDIAVGGVVACAVLRRLTRGHYVVDRVVSGYGGVVAGAAHVRNPYVSAACCRRWIRRDSASSSSAASPARSAGSRSARSRRPRWFRPWTRRSNRRWRAAGWRGDAA